MSLRSHLVSVLEDERGLTAEEVDVSVDLYESGYLDSLRTSEFLLLAEKEFGVSLPDYIIGGSANTLEALAVHIESGLG